MNATPPAIHRAASGGIRLGESPVWSTAEQVLYWIDIEGRCVRRHDPATGTDETRATTGRPGALALTATPGIVLLAMEYELVWFDWSTGACRSWLELEPSGANRLNDGRPDPAGRMVVGTMWPDTSARRATGRLYQVSADETVVVLDRDVGVPNGLAFDAERRRMYYTDTPTRTVLVADYDHELGTRTNVRPFLDYGPLAGKPDGACIDADGCYWSASVHGGTVIRVTPDGRIDRRVDLPVEHPTMPAFGGDDLTTMFVTSIADDDRSRDRGTRAGFTDGDLLAIEVGVQGRPEPLFAGAPPGDWPERKGRT